MYRALDGNLRLWSVIPNVSSVSDNMKTDTKNEQWNIKVCLSYNLML